MPRKLPNLTVGDLVRIRQWDDMAEEFGVDVVGGIPCQNCFTFAMEHLCGHIAMVTGVTGSSLSLEFLEPERISGSTVWSYSTDMIENVNG